MAVTVFLDGGGAPGVSTTVAALATSWPGPVLAVDADPCGGALVPGWLSPWWIDGRISGDRNVVSFATDTRHLNQVPAEGLVGHVQEVPHAEHVRVLAGVSNRAQAGAIGAPGWERLASALRDLTADAGPDVLVDAGRWCPQTPWPLIDEADLVLVGVRPSVRHIAAAVQLVGAIREGVPAERLGLVVTAATSREAANAAQALGGVPVCVELPDDPIGARMFSDGTGAPRLQHPRHCPLLRASRRAARRLHTGLHTPTPRTALDTTTPTTADTSTEPDTNTKYQSNTETESESDVDAEVASGSASTNGAV